MTEEERKRSNHIHSHLRQMITDGYLCIRSLSCVNGEHKEEYLWVNPECHVTATFTGEFGKALWDAARFWRLDTTKRYTRRKNGIVVDDYLKQLLDEAIAANR